jgi:hypothetical protein
MMTFANADELRRPLRATIFSCGGRMLPLETLLSMVVLGGCLLAVLLLPFIAGPIHMWRHLWQDADPDFAPEDEAALPNGARRIVAELLALGFADLGTWRHLGANRATGQVALLEHPDTLDVAKVLVVSSHRSRSVSLVFQTRFADGTEAVTANNRVMAGFPALPGITVAWLPEIRDPDELCEVHEQLCDALAQGQHRLGVGSEPAKFLRDESHRIHAHWVATGYYRLDDGCGVYRPTWKGAVLITWRLLWPIKPLFQAWRRHQTSRLLHRLGIAV